MKHKLILGTVQLGIRYGISNSLGKPSEEESFRILDGAYDNGLTVLDSADAYGDANEIIGNYQRTTGRRFEVINKFKTGNGSIHEKLINSLKLIGVPELYCYMYHNFADYEAGAANNELGELRKNKVIKKLGVSLYSTNELRKVVYDPQIDIVQLPVNLFDLSKEKIELLQFARSQGKELHARSVLFQGLFLKEPNSLTGNLAVLKPYLAQLVALSNETGIDIKKIALNFVLHREYIDRVVLGVDHVSQLEENLALLDDSFDLRDFAGIELTPNETHLLNPANWRP